MASTTRPIAGLAALAVLASSPPPGAQPLAEAADDAGAAVHCLDAGRQIVSIKPRGDCRGEVIDAAAAEAVRKRRAELLRSRMGERPQPVPDRQLIGTGTGFFVSDAGDVLTNWHVVGRCIALSVAPVGRARVLAELVAGDREADLALLRAAAAGVRPAAFRKGGAVTLGEPISIVGYPLHGLVAVKPIRRDGEVTRSGLARRPPGRSFEVKVDVRRGNSGGPVLDSRGLVIGVISAKVSTPNAYRATGRLIRDVGVAIDPAAVTAFLARHEVPFRRADRARALSPEEVLAEAERYIAQIECWR